jgi:hypothetical protein
MAAMNQGGRASIFRRESILSSNSTSCVFSVSSGIALLPQLRIIPLIQPTIPPARAIYSTRLSIVPSKYRRPTLRIQDTKHRDLRYSLLHSPGANGCSCSSFLGCQLLSSCKAILSCLLSKSSLGREYGQNIALGELVPILETCSLMAYRIHLFRGRKAIVKTELVVSYFVPRFHSLLDFKPCLVSFLSSFKCIYKYWLQRIFSSAPQPYLLRSFVSIREGRGIIN